jgi:hypothetical protein
MKPRSSFVSGWTAIQHKKVLQCWVEIVKLLLPRLLLSLIASTLNSYFIRTSIIKNYKEPLPVLIKLSPSMSCLPIIGISLGNHVEILQSSFQRIFIILEQNLVITSTGVIFGVVILHIAHENRCLPRDWSCLKSGRGRSGLEG